MSDKSIRRRQSDIGKKTRLLKAAYLSSLTLLLVLVVFTPYLVRSGFWLKGRIVVEEEIFEGALIALLLLVGYFTSQVYKKELDKYAKELKELATKKTDLENKLNDAFCYIGAVNVQLLEIKSVFTAQKKYPENKRDFKTIQSLFARRALEIANVDWVVFRIIKPDTLRTLQEHSETRSGTILAKRHISNRAIACNGVISGCSVVCPEQENLTIKAFCILPTEELTASQEILIRAIVSELEMLFIIFNSEYYRVDYLKKGGRNICHNS